MPKRPKQHQIEDLSRAKFQLCLPEEWVLRDKDKDYGIDGEVELFDENENPLGLLFYVQLKATDSKENCEILNIDFKIETLKYFQQLEIPVLLARYSKHLDKTFIKWINDVDLTFGKKNAKTFRVKIKESDEWTVDSAKRIENDLKNVRKIKSGSFNFPISYSIIFKENNIQGLSNSQFKIQLRNKLNEYSDFLEYKSNDENYLVSIIIQQNILLVQTSILNGVFFHNLDKLPRERFIEELSLYILLSLSICMVIVGRIDDCGKIIFDNELWAILIEKEELLQKLLPALLSSSYFEHTLNLVNKALDNTEKNILLFSVFASILLKSDTKIKKRITQIESFFQSQLDKAEKLELNSLIASSHYNLGNFYRSKGRNKESIHHYVQAKKYDSDYLKRSYYFKEIAGVCFEANKFWFSANFYEKSIVLGASKETKSLQADALMFAGKYKTADKVFQEYITETEEPNEEFLLKALLLQNIIENTKIYTQIRKQEEADKIIGNKPSVEDIERAFDKDLLSSLAWFNLGMIKKDDSDFQEATFCFAMCACINLWNIQAWTFAFLAFINSEDKGNLLIGSLILKTAYMHNRDEFLINLYGILEQNGDQSVEIIKIIDNILKTGFKTNDKSVVLRILNGENY